MEGEQKKRGRPCKKHSRNGQISFRLPLEEKERIEQACHILGVTVTEFIVGQALESANKCIKKQEKKFDKGDDEYEFFYDEDFEDEDFLE